MTSWPTSTGQYGLHNSYTQQIPTDRRGCYLITRMSTMNQNGCLWPRLSISGPEIINILCTVAPTGHRTHAVKIDMKCNESETVCMVFQPKRRSQIVSMSFPQLTLCNFCVQYVVSFKYLGHIIYSNRKDNDDNYT